MNLFNENRRLLLSEKGTVHKDPGGKISICLVYPNTYHVGMSNLGFTGLYTLLNDRDDVFCERAFLPQKDGIDWLKRTKSKFISFESGRQLSRFDIIAFSVSFENDYSNVLKILDLANIEYHSSERTKHDPLIIMGGPCAFLNPEPLSDFMDAVFVGEAENELDDMIRIVKSETTKDDVLRSMAEMDGYYVPSFYRQTYAGEGTIQDVRKIYNKAPDIVKRVYVKDIDKTVLRSRLSTPNAEFSDMYLIETMRGCPFSCRFCAAGHIYDPPRSRSEKILSDEIGRAKQMELKAGLIAPSLSEYRGLTVLLSDRDVYFSITSLRASKRSAEIIKMLKGKRSVSIAPEAGSQRLRDVINKKISEDDILETSGIILKSDIKNLKLYFMIGLPSETDEDIDAIIDLTEKIRALSRKGTLSLTLSIFVPKPFTPFQWHPMTDEKIIRARIGTVKKALSQKKVEVGHDAVRDAYIQGLLAMGDRRVGDALIKMNEEYNWKKACTQASIDPSFYIFRKKERDEKLPWDFIDNGVSKEKLWEEYMKALEI
jgi:radical SAM superfamily enzyme YgiQ (UPF0313 family)